MNNDSIGGDRTFDMVGYHCQNLCNEIESTRHDGVSLGLVLDLCVILCKEFTGMRNIPSTPVSIFLSRQHRTMTLDTVGWVLLEGSNRGRCS